MSKVKRNTHFNNSWTLKTECCTWLVASRLSTEARCTICDTTFSVASSGFAQVQQHATTSKHRAKLTTTSNQTKLLISSTGTVTMKPGTGQALCHDDKVTRAEILMLFRMVKHNYSLASHDDLIEVLKLAFPDDDIVKDMSLASTKSSYSIAYGIGPFFHSALVNDVQREFYSLIVDETTTQQSTKQLDLHVKYWSNKEDKVATRYLGSCFLGHATAEIMNNNIIAVLSNDGLSIQKLLMLSCDGPTVNVALKKRLDNEIKDAGGKSLIEIGPCNLHVVHNAFRTGLNAVPSWSVQEFVTDIFYWFKNYPSRREDYISVHAAFTDEEICVKFLRFVDNRWLSMGPVVVRIIQQFDVLREFFLKGKFDSTTKENARFKRICAQLQSKNITLLRLHFVANITADFERFLTIFQDSSPLIHLLHDEMTELVRRILMRFVKQDLVTGKSARGLVSFVESKLKSENYVSVDSFNIGTEAGKILKEMKADKTQYTAYKTSTIEFTKFFEVCTAYMVKKLPLTNVLLKNIACLSPLFRQQSSSIQMIVTVVENLPYICSSTMIDDVRREWQQYQRDEIPENFFISLSGQKEDGSPFVEYHRIDYYWHKIKALTDAHGNQKYPALGTVAKMALSLSHGQADVERGFSINKQILDSRTALNQKTLCGMRTVKEVVTRCGSITNIPITPVLLKEYRNAHKAYKLALEKEKDETTKNMVHGKRQLMTDENSVTELCARKREWEEKQHQAEKLIAEGTDRLTAAVKSGKVSDVLPSQALLESGSLLCHFK